MTPLRPVTGQVATPSRSRRGAGGFAVPAGGVEQAACTASAASAGIGLLGLQEVPERPEDRARRRAGALLQELRALQLDLLRGGLDPARVARLQAVAAEEAGLDAGLAAILAEIGLRARIEAARARRAYTSRK